MPVLATEPKMPSDVLKWDVPAYSREAVTVASGSGVVEIGAVLGRVTASGKYVPYNPAGADGSQNATAVLIGRVDATTADVNTVAVVRLALVVRQALVFGGSVTAPQKDAAIAALAALGIIARQGA